MKKFSSNKIFLIFETMSICSNIIQWKYLKTTLILWIGQIKQVYKFPNFCLSEMTKETDLKFLEIVETKM